VGEPEVTFAARRLRNASLALAALAVAGGTVWLHHLALRDTSFLTGWLLVAAFVVLAGYNLRKKLPFLPLADSASWLQVHLYVGVLAIALFLMHAGLTLPTGVLESVLWVLVVALLVTGLFGIAISRLVPSALTQHGERIIYERIPAFRAQLAREVAELVTSSVEQTASGTVASYYTQRLQPFFAGPRHFWAHLLGSARPRQTMCRELRALERYVDKADLETLDEIEARVLAKDNLDYQHAWQSLLKGWLFLHIPLTYATIVVAAVHVVLAYAFASATP
jgi:hypothetical protein